MATGDIIVEIAEAYVAVLQAFPWHLRLARDGGREGLTKFLKNAYLRALRGNKYRKAQFVTAEALERLRAGGAGLVFEHAVPTNLLQRQCESLAVRQELTVDFVVQWLRRFWVTVTVTKDEDKRLARLRMPIDWDGLDPFQRYRAAGLRLLVNSEAVPGVPCSIRIPPDIAAGPVPAS